MRLRASNYLLVLITIAGAVSGAGYADQGEGGSGAIKGFYLGDCSPEKMATASVGSECHTRNAHWVVEKERYLGKRIYRDMKSGMKVTEPLVGLSDQYGAPMRCGFGYHLPSGYPSYLVGRCWSFDEDSDFTVMEDDGFRQVVPGLADRRFWSSSEAPYEPDHSLERHWGYYFNSYDGAIDDTIVRSQEEAVLCVSDRARSAESNNPYR